MTPPKKRVPRQRLNTEIWAALSSAITVHRNRSHNSGCSLCEDGRRKLKRQLLGQDGVRIIEVTRPPPTHENGGIFFLISRFGERVGIPRKKKIPTGPLSDSFAFAFLRPHTDTLPAVGTYSTNIRHKLQSQTQTMNGFSLSSNTERTDNAFRNEAHTFFTGVSLSKRRYTKMKPGVLANCIIMCGSKNRLTGAAQQSFRFYLFVFFQTSHFKT